MSQGEEFNGVRGEYPSETPRPEKLLDGFIKTGERLYDAIEYVTAAPTRRVMADFYGAVGEAKGYLQLLHDSDFFKAESKDLADGNELISLAIATFAENLKVALRGIKRLYPDVEPAITITPARLQYKKDPPSLKITVKDGAIEAEEYYYEHYVIEELAQLMAARSSREAAKISDEMLAVGTQAYDDLLNGLEVHPLTKEFLKKEARKKKLKDSARKVGMAVLPTFVTRRRQSSRDRVTN